MMRYRSLLAALIFGIALLNIASAQTSSFAGSVAYQPRASFQAIYGPEGGLETYWPILGDKDTCLARQDLLLQVAPAGCTPSVVRSDLLAEQNVPVFCQIDAVQINPLIDIKQISNIRFSSEEKLAKMAKAVIGLDNFGGSGYIVIFKLFKILIIC